MWENCVWADGPEELVAGTVRPLMLLCRYSCIELWRPDDPAILLVLTLLEFATVAFGIPEDVPRLDLMLCYTVGYT
jgi:hypothetical protein